MQVVSLSAWGNSVTGCSPARSSTRICRRRGSAMALKTSEVVAARAITEDYIPISVCVKVDGASAEATEQQLDAARDDQQGPERHERQTNPGKAESP